MEFAQKIMDLEKLEQDLRSIIIDTDERSFIYELLIAYGQPKSSIARLRKGDYNQSKNSGEVLWKKRLFFRSEPTKSEAELLHLIDSLSNDAKIKKHHPRFIIVTNYEEFLAIDTKTADSLDIRLTELPKRANFFLPWAGMERSAITSENPADVKAAEKMGQLYDLLLHNNEIESEESRHALNVFLSRLLFCFFAEDTHIFNDDQFTKLVDSHTVEDGGNLQPLLERLFKALNTEDRSDYPDYIQEFPYVNGGLFAGDLPVPEFSRKSRKMLIDCGALNWKAINPDIFGSMMQAVTLGEERSSIGMHYTSVVNIMKAIEPLFLNDMKEELGKADGNEKRLEKLLDRLYHVQIFDPACGSGNFLIIAYKALCRLEIEIFQQLQKLNSNKWGVARSGIKLNQFFGIEIDDFAVETARLSLWLAEHQMNIEFQEVFGESKATLPLTDAGKIVCGNATRLEWESICPVASNSLVFVLGNPPYLGAKERGGSQREDMAIVFDGLGNVNRLDYIACWFKKCADYISDLDNVRAAFVTTSSICQGEQVSLIWPYIKSKKVDIDFAYEPFNWSNNARDKAGVNCSIIGLAHGGKKQKYIYSFLTRKKVSRINAYLVDGPDVIMQQRTSSLSGFPKMVHGSSGFDGGHLMLTKEERGEFLDNDSNADRFIKRFYGGRDFLHGHERYCLWIPDDSVDAAKDIEPIAERIEKCRSYRLSAGRDARKGADVPHRFFYRKYQDGQVIVFPTTSSENREYVPVGYLDSGSVLSNGLFVIYDQDPFIFGVLSSRMHMVWMKALAGRLRSDIRYSVNLVYNTFPFRSIAESKREEIVKCVFAILDIREEFTEYSLAQIYSSEQMPEQLFEAHIKLDQVVESTYKSSGFSDDKGRLSVLFDLYLEMSVTDAVGS